VVGINNPISPTILDTYGTAAKAVKMGCLHEGNSWGSPPPGAMGGGK
jgi:hypothetical protein